MVCQIVQGWSNATYTASLPPIRFSLKHTGNRGANNWPENPALLNLALLAPQMVSSKMPRSLVPPLKRGWRLLDGTGKTFRRFLKVCKADYNFCNISKPNPFFCQNCKYEKPTNLGCGP